MIKNIILNENQQNRFFITTTDVVGFTVGISFDDFSNFNLITNELKPCFNEIRTRKDMISEYIKFLEKNLEILKGIEYEN